MRFVGRLAIIVATAASANVSALRPAVAAEAFLCGPDTVIYVELGELEHMKRTNACIAGYFGLTADGAADAVSDRAPVGKADGVAMRLLSDSQDGTAAQTDKAQRIAMRLKSPRPVPAPNTDFRNVHILNAESEGQSWYRHLR